MWHWDQGRLSYFNFDNLRVLSRFALENDFKEVSQEAAHRGTGLPFLPSNYMPWRNYSRVLKLSLIVAEKEDIATPSPVAFLLAEAGAVTCDEYMHFIVQTFTSPSPALKDWNPQADFRFPLVFSLKYILTKIIVLGENTTSLNEIVGAYAKSGFSGYEGESEFIQIIGNIVEFKNFSNDNIRQARESLKVLSQISYLHYYQNNIIISLDKTDAEDIFREIEPVQGKVSDSSNKEIFRLANLFKGGSSLDFFDYKNTVSTNVFESGFKEGGRVKKTHVTIERNRNLKATFFKNNTTAVCDACNLDTKKRYPWTERVLDLHHLLPLASGTRVEARGTLLTDLVPICPSCHRSVHQYYDLWLNKNNKNDFENYNEVTTVYKEIKKSIERGVICGL